MKLHGLDGLRKRLEAMDAASKTIPPRWGRSYVSSAQSMIPVRRGVTRRSIRLGAVDGNSADIVGSEVAVLLDTGTKAHDEAARGGVMAFGTGSRTIFARRVHHPGTRAQKWRTRAADAATRKTPLGDIIVGAWNKAD